MTDITKPLAELEEKWQNRMNSIRAMFPGDQAAERIEICRDELHAVRAQVDEAIAALQATAITEQHKANAFREINAVLDALVEDSDIVKLAFKLVDTAGADRKTYWIPLLSQLCEAVRKQDKESGRFDAHDAEVRDRALEE